jgi:hypothetical protein
VQLERRLGLIPRVTEANKWHIHLRVLCIIREGGPHVSVWTSEEAKRKPAFRPLASTDFSRSRIDEHYETSRPAKWSESQQKIEAKRRSAETNTDFLVNKLTAHFCRVHDSSVKKKESCNVGELIEILYEKDEAYAADDPDVRSVRILERYGSDSDDGSGNEDHQGCVEGTPLNTIFWSGLILAANLQREVTWSLQIVSQLQGIANCRS